MGKWDLRVSHDSVGDPKEWDSKMTGEDDKLTHAGVAKYVKLWTYVYPTAESYQGTGDYLSGYFKKEYALEGHYYWAGDSNVEMHAHSLVRVDWDIRYNGHPSERWGGLWYWFQGEGDSNHREIGITSYDTGSGHRSVRTGAQIRLHPGHTCYISFGSRVYVDYDGTSASYDDWHHWDGSVKTTVNDFWFTLE